MRYGITQCYLPPDIGDFPPLPQLKLVLDLATPEGCKAELTWSVMEIEFISPMAVNAHNYMQYTETQNDLHMLQNADFIGFKQTWSSRDSSLALKTC